MTSVETFVSQTLPCPNCGSPAHRHWITDQNMTRTQCRTCDYLLITCQQTGKVIEFYAPGVEAIVLRKRQAQAIANYASPSLRREDTQDVR